MTPNSKKLTRLKRLLTKLNHLLLLLLKSLEKLPKTSIGRVNASLRRFSKPFRGRVQHPFMLTEEDKSSSRCNTTGGSVSFCPSLKDFFPTHLVYNDGVLSPFLLSAGVLSLSESASKNFLFEYSYFNVASAPPLGVKHPIFLVILISSSIVVTRVTRPSPFDFMFLCFHA